MWKKMNIFYECSILSSILSCHKCTNDGNISFLYSVFMTLVREWEWKSFVKVFFSRKTSNHGVWMCVCICMGNHLIWNLLVDTKNASTWIVAENIVDVINLKRNFPIHHNDVMEFCLIMYAIFSLWWKSIVQKSMAMFNVTD